MFPEGRGVVGGWKLLAGKLRSLGFSLTQRGEESKASGGKEYSIVEVETSSSVEIHNAVWLEIEKKVIVSNEEVLKGSLGDLGGGDSLTHPLTSSLLSPGLSPFEG